MNEARAVLVMGVSGSGKSTVARPLAERLGARFVEADELHPLENVAMMERGEPLGNAQRWGWLDKVAEAAAAGTEPAVIACSALKRAYRDRLRRGLSAMSIVHLTGSRALLAERMQMRKGHFMPVSLLDSQLADLEPPGQEEVALALDVSASVEELVARAMAFAAPRLTES